MKKIIISMVIFTMMLTGAKANEAENYCAKEACGVGNAFTRFVSNITGLNFIKTKAVETVFQNILKKEMKSNFNVEIYPFGEKSLSEGKFKKIIVTSKHITSPNLYLTNFKLESLCPYNKVTITDDAFYFNENFVAQFEGTITDMDFKKMLIDTMNKTGKVDIKVAGVSLFKISNPDVSIKNKRVNIEMDVQFSNFIVTKTSKVNVNTALSIQNGEIEFSDTKIGSKYAINTQAISPFINALNPFSQKIKIDKYNEAEIKIKKLEFKDEEIELQGIVVIPAYSKY